MNCFGIGYGQIDECLTCTERSMCKFNNYVSNKINKKDDQFLDLVLTNTKLYSLKNDEDYRPLRSGSIVEIIDQLDNVAVVNYEDDDNSDFDTLVRMSDLTKVYQVHGVKEIDLSPTLKNIKVFTDKIKMVVVEGNVNGMDFWGSSACNPNDRFEFYKGLDIALSRAMQGYYTERLEKLTQ